MRRFFLLVAVGLTLWLVTVSAQTSATTPDLVPQQVILDQTDFAQGSHQRTRPAADGVQADPAGGTYTTPVQQVAQFSDVLVSWRADEPVSSTLKLSIRVSNDNITWSKWGEIHEDHDLHDERDSADLHWGSSLFAGVSQYWQVKAEFSPAPSGELPVLTELRVNTVDVGTMTPPKPAPSQNRASGNAKPYVVSRTGWGSGDGQGSRVPPDYYPVNHMVVHHTADANSLVNNEGWWGDRVRGIWVFHTITRGWGDIGYNFLIAPDGTIFEGRAGGDNAVGFHDTGNYGSMGVSMIGTYASVAPTGAAQDSLVDVLAWKAEQRGIDPLGSSYYYGCDISRYCGNVGAITPNIGGHRNVANYPAGYTSCPGDSLFSILPTIRARVQSRLSSNPDNGDLTIDDLESSFTRSAAEWYEASCGDGGHMFYTFATNDPLESTNSGVWRKENLPAGNYRIYAHIPQNCGALNATQSAKYTIWQNGVQLGDLNKIVSQDTRSEWVEITSAPVSSSGLAMEVHLKDLTNEPMSANRKVIFDTVRWVKEDQQTNLRFESVSYYPTTVASGDLVKVTFKIKNIGNVAVKTQAPDAGNPNDPTSGYTYDEGECFLGNTANTYPAFPKESGRVRLMLGGDNLQLDCQGDTGGYPWRWGIGGDLQPGQVREITGYVRFRTYTANRQVTLKAGIVQEYVKYINQDQYKQTITVTPENDAPQSVMWNDWQPQATVYALGSIPDDFLARTANPLSIPEGQILGNVAWDGTRLDLGYNGLFGRNDFFVVRQTRTFYAPVSGNYKFRITSDDGSWLWIDGTLVAEAHGLHVERETIGERWLAAGTHTLGFKYFERTAQAVLSYDWQTPNSTTWTSVPVHLANGAQRYGSYFAPNAVITVAGDDHGGSGVAAMRWRLNGSAWQQDDGAVLPLTLGGGTYTLDYAAVDNVGNIEPYRTMQFTIDANAPSSSITSATVQPSGVIRLDLAANDTASGVREVEISVRDQADGTWRVWTTTNQTFAIFFGTPGHSYDFRVRATDNVGNREAVHAGVDASATTPLLTTFTYSYVPLVQR